MTDNTCNGWSNHETWCANLWLGDSFKSFLSEMDLSGKKVSDVASIIQNYFDEIYESRLSEMPTDVLSDILKASILSINWWELAEHYLEEVTTD